MKKLIFSLIAGLLLCAGLFAQKVKFGVLNGPTCIPAASMMDNQKDRTFTVFADPQALLPKMVKKEVDVGFMPLNVAAKVYNSGNKAILCCAVTGLGNIKVITTDKSVRSFTDLKGKTVYTAGQGATPEYMLRYLLTENKLTYSTDGKPADVKIDFSIPTAQIAAQMISGKIGYPAACFFKNYRCCRIIPDLQHRLKEQSCHTAGNLADIPCSRPASPHIDTAQHIRKAKFKGLVYNLFFVIRSRADRDQAP